MLTFRKMRLEDMDQLAKWGQHSDVRFTHYDFRYFDAADYRHWYFTKQKPPFRWIYALVDAGTVVGFTTLKHFNWLTGSAEFGLVINPDCLDRGYGTEGLKRLMHHFFRVRRMRVLRLKVAVFNERAYTVYKRLGFQTLSTRLLPFEDQTRHFELLLNTKDFTMKGRKLMTAMRCMAMTKSDYLALYTDL